MISAIQLCELPALTAPVRLTPEDLLEIEENFFRLSMPPFEKRIPKDPAPLDVLPLFYKCSTTYPRTEIEQLAPPVDVWPQSIELDASKYALAYVTLHGCFPPALRKPSFGKKQTIECAKENCGVTIEMIAEPLGWNFIPMPGEKWQAGLKPGTSYLCQKHTRNLQGCSSDGELTPQARLPVRTFGIIRPGPFEYSKHGRGFEYLLRDEVSFEEANRAHTRRLNSILENRPHERIDRDIQFSQLDNEMRQAYYIKEDASNKRIFQRRGDNPRHKDDDPESIAQWLNKSLLKKVRFCSETNEPIFCLARYPSRGGGGLIYEFDLHDEDECKALDELTRATIEKLIVPFRPDPIEGRAIQISRGGERKSYILWPKRFVLPSGPSLPNEGDEILYTLTDTKQGKLPLHLTFSDYWYERALRGELRNANDLPEDLKPYDPKDGRAIVFVNVNHHNFLLAARMYDEVYAAGERHGQYEGKTEKEIQAMKKQASRELEKITNEKVDFARWKLDDLLLVWRERKPVAVITSGREYRVFPLDIARSPEQATYDGLVSGLGGNPRQIAIETAAWAIVEDYFDGRVKRDYKDGKEWSDIVETIRENQNARVFTIDFGSLTDTPEQAPDELWHLADAVLKHEDCKDVPISNHPEIKDILRFYPDLYES